MSWMTQSEAAAVLGCSIRTVRRKIRSSSLKARREGRNVLVELDTDGVVPGMSLARPAPQNAPVSPVVRSTENADTLTAMSAAVKENLSVLSECRQQLESNIKRMRRSNRTGWILALALLAALAGLGWLYHQGTLGHLADLHDLRQTFTVREAQFDEALASTTARHEGEADVLRLALSHERIQVESAEEHSVDLVQQLATLSAEHNGAVNDRDHLAAERDLLAADLRRTERAANVADTVRAIFSAVRLAAHNLPSVAELRQLREQTRTAGVQHERAIAAAQAESKTELAAVRGRYEGELEALKASLDHERQTVTHLEERIRTMADRLVSVSTDRGRLKLEEVRLRAEVDHLSAGLEQATRATDMAVTRKPDDRVGQVDDLP